MMLKKKESTVNIMLLISNLEKELILQIKLLSSLIWNQDLFPPLNMIQVSNWSGNKKNHIYQLLNTEFQTKFMPNLKNTTEPLNMLFGDGLNSLNQKQDKLGIIFIDWEQTIQLKKMITAMSVIEP